jgi:uncharacterized protein (DUF488 family)
VAETVYTIGHSTYAAEDFRGMLQNNGVELIADVRAIPGSRRNPQFSPDELTRCLAEAGIGYLQLKDLGGRRYSPVGEPTINDAWRNHSFRSYADYMQTPPFASAIDELIELAGDHRVALMCAEAVPWRCHRSLIADALIVRGVEVLDIMSATSTKRHALTSFARVDGSRIWYPAPPE